MIFLAALGVFLAVQGYSGGLAGEATWIALLWLGFLLWIWYVYLRIPYEIKFRDDNLLDFKSIVKTTVVAPRNVISIKGAFMNLGFIIVRHTGGTIRLICQMTGLYDLIYNVKTLNPDAEIKGC